MFAFYGASPASLQQLQSHHDKIDVLAPTGYTLTRSGLTGAPDPRTLTLCRSLGVAYWPVVGVQNPNLHAISAALLASLPERSGAAGLTLDFEGMSPDEGPAFLALVTSLAAALHANGHSLAIYTPRPNAGDGAYQRAALANVADVLLVSAYNEHWASSTPGPIATAAGVQASIDCAQGAGANSGIVAGAFGYSWNTTPAKLFTAAQGPDMSAASGEGGCFWEGPSDTIARYQAATAARLQWFGLYSLGFEADSVWEGIA